MSKTVLLSDLLFALTAGVATFFSPCAYPLLPSYVGYYASRDISSGTFGHLVRGLTASVGVLVTFVVVGGVIVVVGARTVSRIELFELVAGVVLFVFGALVLLDREPSLSIALPKRRTSVLGFGIFGAGYALAAIGCVVPLFFGVVGRALSLPPEGTMVMLGTYVSVILGLMLALTVIVGVGVGASVGRYAAYGNSIKRLAGAVMAVSGIGQLYLAVYVLDVI